MVGRLQDRVAVVTGGASGIGKAVALLFASEGAMIAIGDCSDEAKDVVCEIERQGGEAIYVNTDVAKEDDVKHLMNEAVTRFGKIDVLIANAGIDQISPAHETSLADWQKMIDINLTGVFLSNKYAIMHMLTRQSGAIVNISSILGQVGQPDITAYAAAKGGVSNLTRSIAVTYANQGIRVNAVCPGYIETPLLRDLSDEMVLLRVSKHPMGRMGRPVEVAHACLFLASEEASFVTGINLFTDGGYTAQ
ncbi:SDR family NAD(P)-dependent oxidoreductase [Brevibacillus sp. NRS-1366]|uniref:SDR family NAD(P)-dependent oxidoreductase n=1 Tax=Brevibacillus sp. NRS-1366 TaxID=3233899 RepID=UPI003D1B11F0